jgi:hypothetical protein
MHVHGFLPSTATCFILKSYCATHFHVFCFRVLVTFSQYFQKCPFEEHVKLVNEVNEFVKTCVADESAANCDKDLVSAF